MIDLQDKNYCPAIGETGEYVRNPVFMKFKFKKAGKTLCTIYPREGYFTVMIVVGTKEKASVEAILPECTAELNQIYNRTEEGNGQRWLMIDLEDQDGLCHDVLRLIRIRRNSQVRV